MTPYTPSNKGLQLNSGGHWGKKDVKIKSRSRDGMRWRRGSAEVGEGMREGKGVNMIIIYT